MYHKFINDREVFSTCKTIELDGVWISNPTAEMIALAGWEPYTPPETIPQPQEEPEYYDIIEAVKKLLASSVESLSDEDALEVAAAFPTWASKLKAAQGKGVVAGERLWYDNNLYKVVQSHTPQSDWTPDITPSLYTMVSLEEIPDWVQPVGSTGIYMLGDKVKHNNKTWESEYNNNSWEPGVFGWKEV